MAQDLSIRAILTCQTQAFDGGMKRAARSAQEFSRTTRREFEMLESRLNGLAKKGFGAIGIGAQLAGEALGAGSRVGRIIGGVGNVAGQAAVGGLAGGPIGAAIFGGIAALKEFKEAVSSATKEVAELTSDIARDRFEKRQLTHSQNVANARQKLRTAFGLDLPESMPGLSQQEVEGFRANETALGKQRMDLIQRSQFLQFGRFGQFTGRQAFVERGIQELRNAGRSTMFMRPELGNQFDKQLKAVTDSLEANSQSFEALDKQVNAIIAGRFFVQLPGKGIGLGIGIGGGFLNALQNTNFAAADVFLNPLRHKLGGIGILTQMNMAQEAEIASRVMRLQGMSSTSGPGFERGSQGYLQAIHDEKKPLDELVKLAKQEIEQEKKQATEIAKAIAAQRVTVNMN